MKLPFALDLAAWDGTRAVVDIALQGEDTQVEFDGETLKPSAEMVELYAIAANLQCFGSLGPARCSFALEAREVQADWRVWRFRYCADGLPPQSLVVLIALLAQTGYAGDPLARVSVQARPAAASGPEWLAAQATKVPARHRDLPFRVESGLPGRKQRRVAIEFTQPPDERARAVLEEAVNVWSQLVAFGGFQLDFAEQAGFDPSFGSIAWPQANVLAHAFFLDGSETAFDALLNVLRVVHLGGREIVSVRIE